MQERAAGGHGAANEPPRAAQDANRPHPHRPHCHPSRHRRPRPERASTTWSTSSFTSYHGQLLSLAVQWGVAIEIERAIKKSASFC